MRMDDMAIEWVEQVLSFLPITDVYKCRSVCKKWQAAANYVISDCSTLALAYKWGSTRDAPHKNRILLNTAAVLMDRQARKRPWIWHKKKTETDATTWIERLKHIVRLKAFYFVEEGFAYSEDLVPVVHDVVRVNASSLKLLHMSSIPVPSDPNHTVMYSNLQDLECSLLLDPDWVAACPRLVKLRTRTTVQALYKVPAETLTSLQIDYLEFETGSPEEIEQLVAAFSRFTRLKCLILDEGLSYFYFGDQWTELHDQALSLLFTNMKELEDVYFALPKDRMTNVDALIETLVHNNPSVRSIRMEYAQMTDASLHSLSRLTGLQSFGHGHFELQNGITTEGILSLLRGGSRNVLQELELKVTVLVRPDEDQIRAEGNLMQQETGSLFSFEVVEHNTFLVPLFTISLRLAPA